MKDMVIQRFFAPASEVESLGLHEINMSRLGRFVALAGKNGAGKSRILQKLEEYCANRRLNWNKLEDIRGRNRYLESAMLQNPENQQVPQWRREFDSNKLTIETIVERVIPATPSQFKAVRFVPKQLQLQDPKQHASGELASRYNQAKSPGLNGYEQRCLFYVQQLQTRWWNADHQRFSGTKEEKASALAEYDDFQKILQRLLGVELDRNIDGDPTLFGKPIAQAGLSDGQKVILQLCVALHAQRGELENTIFLLDEPENHLHRSATIDLLKSLYHATETSQIWIATHSIPLLAYVASVDPMSLWFVEGGSITNAGRHPEVVLQSLLGDEQGLGQLHSFTGLPAQLAAVNYAKDSLFPPKVVANGDGDSQVSQIQRIIKRLGNGSPLSVLDFGAGKGRLLEGIAAESVRNGERPSNILNYFAFDPFPDDAEPCKRVIAEFFPTAEECRYFNSREEFFARQDEKSIAVVVMCNVLHEISPRDWLDLLSSQSLILRAMRDDGYLLVVEDQRIPVGEKAHEYGFIVLDTSHLRTLFSINNDDVAAERFICDDGRKDGRLKAHLIAKPLLTRISPESIRQAVAQLRETAKENIQQLRKAPPNYANGQLHGFWTQQFANTSLFLAGA